MTLKSMEDLFILVTINEECENLNLVVDGRELTKNINKKKKPGVLQTCRCTVCDKC